MKKNYKNLIIALIVVLSVSSVWAQTSRWRLIWDKNTEEDMASYELYKRFGTSITRESDADNIIIVDHNDSENFLNDSTMFYTDDDLVFGIQIFYRLKAVDQDGLKSIFSEEVSAAIPKITDNLHDIMCTEPGVTCSFEIDSTMVEDPDNNFSEIKWDSDKNSLISIDFSQYPYIVNIDTILGEKQSFDVEFTAMDPDSFYDVKVITITNDSSLIPQDDIAVNLPDTVSTLQGIPFGTLNLDQYVDYGENPVDDLDWDYSYTVQAPNINVEIQNRIASFSVIDSAWTGSEDIIFIALDNNTGKSDADTVAFTVFDTTNHFNLPPVVSGIPDQTIILGQDFSDLELDDYVLDPDDPDEDIVWTASGNQYINVDIDHSSRIAEIIKPTESNWTGTETIIFIATDPEGLSDSDTANFTIEPAEIQTQAEVTAYPIPYRTNQGASHITFTNLPIGGELLIYDLLGYPVFKTDIMASEYPWRTLNQSGKWVRSGVYLYVVKDSKGKKVKSDKIIIIR